MPTVARPRKITFGEMRDMGVRGILVYCADYRCSHSVAMSADEWPVGGSPSAAIQADQHAIRKKSFQFLIFITAERRKGG
jgi:hypothetical protein